MSAKFDPTIELPSTPILIMAFVLAIVAFGVVGFIVFGDASSTATAPAGQ